MKFSNPKEIFQKNIIKEKDRPGLYIILDKDLNELYIGSSKNLQHRLQAILYARSDYVQVNSKKILRKKAIYYKTHYTDINRARKFERNYKKKLKFNHL